MQHRSDWLVIAQFALLIALLVIPGPPLVSALWITVAAIVLALAGLALAVAGVVGLGRDIVPWVAPKKDASLRTRGVFGLTRNPIYLGILIGTAGWALWRARVDVGALWLLLVVVLVAKAHVEQRYLLAAFGEDYQDYAERTPLILWGRGIR